MLSRLKLVALAGVVAAAALLPLYGDPRNSPVTHAEWGRMLLRALDLETALPVPSTASQAFAVLSWKQSLSFPAERYARGDDVRVEGDAPSRRVRPTGEVGEVSYPVAVVRAGDYRVRVRMAGSAEHPASAELARVGETGATGAFSVVPAATMGWVDAGTLHLDPGAYTATVLLPRGAVLEHLEVAPPCLASIEPPGGWKATAGLVTEDAAVTMVQALDQQSELPPAATPIEVDASHFKTESGLATEAAAGTGVEGFWLRAGPGGLRAVVFVELPEPGLYTMSAFGVLAGGQSWLADGCRKSVLCAGREPAEAQGPQWRTIMTGEFTAGPHFFSVVLGPGAALERFRAERKKDSPADYAATLRRLGFDVGGPGPMPRDRAVDAMRFLERRLAPLRESRCGDVVLPTTPTTRAGLQVARIPGPGQPVPPAGPGQPPLGGPLTTPPVLVSPTPASPVQPAGGERP